MTIEEFAARYNQETEWNKEILDNGFLNSNPFINSEFGDYVQGFRITPETCDYSTAQIFEEGIGTDRHYFELQVYSVEACHDMYFWIHPDRCEGEYKIKFIRELLKETRAIKSRLTNERDEIDGKLEEIHEFMKLINKKETV